MNSAFPVKMLRNIRDLSRIPSSLNAKLFYLQQKTMIKLNPWRFMKTFRRVFPDFTEQTRFINSGNWDTLIILDACRYDTFEKIVHEFLDGEILRVKSPASMTICWLRRTWHRVYKDTIYVSAHPMVNSSVPIDGFYARKKFLKVIDVWRYHFDDFYSTTPPWAMNSVLPRLLALCKIYKYKTGKRPRLVLHYVQPHFPYIGSIKAIRIAKEAKELMHQLGLKHFEYCYAVLIRFIEEFNGDIEALARFLRDSYERTLRLTLKHLSLILETLDGRIVITSDHGELLGEHGLFFHPGLLLPELRFVPWFKVR